MINAVASTHIDAPAEQVAALYADISAWPRLFPETIRGARIIQESSTEQVIEVDHVEGHVLNVLERRSPNHIELNEYKRRYDATFTNAFEPEPRGMRYTVVAHVRLKWPYRLLAPIVKPLVISRMQRYVLAPMKVAAEALAPKPDLTRIIQAEHPLPVT